MSDDLKIRLATPADLKPVMAMAIMAAEENGFLDASTPRLLNDIWPALNQDHGLCAVIGPHDGNIEGIMVLRIGTLYYSDQMCIDEKVIYIHPDYRSAKGGRAAKLCEFGKRTADVLGLPICVGVLSNTRTAAKVKMYERIFGPAAGAFFLYGAVTRGHKLQGNQ
jgi:hypothetical protein